MEKPEHRPLKRAVSAVAPWLLLVAASCGRQELPLAPAWQALDPPAAAGAMAPRWTAGPGLSWLEPVGDGHRLVLAYRSGAGWSEPEVVREGEGFFANWADVPAVLRLSASDGAPPSRIATWLESSGQGTYAYGVRLASSKAPGEPWQPLGWLHPDDTSATEHGFVSLLADSDSEPATAPAAWAFWLDGRAMVDGGAMSLRGVRLNPDPGSADVLDDRVCDCCQTGAAMTSEGPIVVYRDRSADEVRDISLVRYVGGNGRSPKPSTETAGRSPVVRSTARPSPLKAARSPSPGSLLPRLPASRSSFRKMPGPPFCPPSSWMPKAPWAGST